MGPGARARRGNMHSDNNDDHHNDKHMNMNLNMHVCVYSACVYICICICIYIYTYISMYVCVYVFVYMCIYIYIYTYTHILTLLVVCMLWLTMLYYNVCYSVMYHCWWVPRARRSRRAPPISLLVPRFSISEGLTQESDVLLLHYSLWRWGVAFHVLDVSYETPDVAPCRTSPPQGIGGTFLW